jgi:hypothetical protein
MDHQAFAQLLGNYGEFVGAIAVVITLAYLAIQIRQNTSVTRAASHHAIVEALNRGNLAQAEDGELAQIWVSGTEDRGGLSEVERQRFDMLLLSYFHVFDSLWYSAKIGTVERDLLLSEEKSFVHLMNCAGVYDWWQANPYSYSNEFRSYMEEFRSAKN